jgi:hypothetical protein
MGIQPVLSAPRSPGQRAYVERGIGMECLDQVVGFREAGLSRHLRKISRTPTIGVARTWACRRTRPGHARSQHQKPDEASRSQMWVGGIIGTNVAPPEPRSDADS